MPWSRERTDGSGRKRRGTLSAGRPVSAVETGKVTSDPLTEERRKDARHVGCGGSAKDIVAAWRYQLDADAAGQTRLTVGIQVIDSAEEVTVRLRNSILLVEDGIAADADAVVEVTTEQLADASSASTISGDSAAFGKLVGFLDRQIVGFSMHQR